jgi:hypothetical protein
VPTEGPAALVVAAVEGAVALKLRRAPPGLGSGRAELEAVIASALR